MKLINSFALFLSGYLSSVLADIDIEKPFAIDTSDYDKFVEMATEEWMDISNGGDNRVFNFGIGSLTSYGSRQYTESNSDLTNLPSVKDMSENYPASASGIQRSLNDCWRYAAMTATQCTKNTEAVCSPVEGVIFQIDSLDSYIALRERENNYELVTMTNVKTDPDLIKIKDDDYVFAWGLNIEYVPVGRCYFGGDPDLMTYPARVSQSYWDFIIGGILSWDGQLLDSDRYSWDLDLELSWVAKGIDIRPYVHKYPLVGSLAKRREIAVNFVKTTEHSTYEWMDDRKCPFTGNANIVLTKDLEYTKNVFGKGVAHAFGTVSPMVSQAFYDYVDQILIDGGWEYGARNSIHQRSNPCETSGDYINRRGDSWKKNDYYKDIVKWNKRLGVEVKDQRLRFKKGKKNKKKNKNDDD